MKKIRLLICVGIVLFFLGCSCSFAEGSDDNANLSVLRLEYVGISPKFDANIKEYYFIANGTIDNLGITAIPENEEANVTISGNENLQYGRNVVNIEVQSKDGTNSEVYRIYVTKTDNLETANANLVTLAVRQGDLSPEFEANVTRYHLEIPNDVYKLDILAIPESEKASVEIIGNDEMEVGDNTIEIKVLAEDGITDKKYEIIVHRRNAEEEAASVEEGKLQAERLSAILNGDKSFRQIENLRSNSGNNIALIGGITIISGIIIGAGLYYAKKHRR